MQRQEFQKADLLEADPIATIPGKSSTVHFVPTSATKSTRKTDITILLLHRDVRGDAPHQATIRSMIRAAGSMEPMRPAASPNQTPVLSGSPSIKACL